MNKGNLKMHPGFIVLTGLVMFLLYIVLRGMSNLTPISGRLNEVTPTTDFMIITKKVLHGSDSDKATALAEIDAIKASGTLTFSWSSENRNAPTFSEIQQDLQRATVTDSAT